MGTSFEKVYDRSASLWKDYRLDKLYINDKDSFNEVLRGFLENSIDTFHGCFNDLSYTAQEEQELNKDGILTQKTKYYFNVDLTSKEIYILALGISISLYEQNFNDVTQYELHLKNREFSMFSEAQNHKQRGEVLDKMREDLAWEIQQYQVVDNFDNLPFFGGGDK